MKNWWYSLLLLGAYVLTFELWLRMSRNGIMGSAVGASILLLSLEHHAAAQRYFRNLWDRLFHAAVIADLLIEGLTLPVHEDRGFYLCALGFAAVIAGYRGWLCCQARRPEHG